MNTLPIVLDLLIAQAAMGAWDTIYHHELRAALPQQPGAAPELRIHCTRALLYGVVFAGLAWFEWGGMWMLVLFGIIVVEVVLTLWDFLVEDRSRLLPQSERVLHTILAINGGAIVGLLALHAPTWWQLPHGLHPVSYGWRSIALGVCALGVVGSGLRDGYAARALLRRAHRVPKFHFGNASQRMLVTGGTGFIGQALCRALLADGHEVTLLARDPLKAAYLFNGRV